jgi:AcrR family transcriptional regulator
VHTSLVKKERPTRAEQGEATRAGILAAARQRFAADGYERATIRAIATDAGIDPSLVMRYFVNKEGLFVAAAEIDLRLPELGKVPRGKLGAAMVTHFLQRWESDDILKALLRTAATNEAAAERMRVVWAGQPLPAIAAIGLDARTAGQRASLISSQLLGFAYSRWILKLPPLARMSQADVVRWMGPVIQHYLFGKLAP